MEQKLIEIISDILKLDAKELEQHLDDPAAWDSLHRVEILFSIEDELDLVFDEVELERLDTPRKLIEAALRKVD